MCVFAGIDLFNQCIPSCLSESVWFVLSTVILKMCGYRLVQTDVWIQEKVWLIASVPKNTNAKNINSQVRCLVG